MLTWLAMRWTLGIGLASATILKPVGGHEAPPHVRSTLMMASDSVATHARAVLAISEFFVEWQRLWRGSALLRNGVAVDEEIKDVRLAYLHCHPDAPTGTRVASATGANEKFARKFEQFSLVFSDHSAFATCPSWILSPTFQDAGDEGVDRDGALLGQLRPAARSARARLIVALDSAARRLPGSGLLTGQRVRFLVEQRDLDGALRVARDCRAERWWCLALTAYAHQHRGAWVDAEFTYIAMYEVMPAEVRCAWQDVGDLLAPSDRSAYDKTSCAARAEMHATLWWLSDPLFRVQGNERWVVHQSRHVDVALRSALDGDERYAWNLERGGDALARLLVRYGWPSYTWWDGRLTDNNHSGYLRNKLSTPVPPYTTFEYSMDRVHLLPLRRVLANPLAASDADWELSGVTPAGEIDPGWWSAEHFRTPRRLVQLPEGQTVMLRRQTNIEIASAHRMRQPLMVRDSQRFDVMLLSSTSRNDIDTLAQRGAGSGETAVLRSTIPGAASLLAVEAMGVGKAELDARTRFGIQPPPVLRAMAPGDVAISDPALLEAASGAGDERVAPETLLDHLLGSLSLEKEIRRVGLYWETYGIAAKDTVTFTVSLQGDANVGGLRRLGVALNVASDPNRSLSIRWTEPSPQHYARTLPGAVPVQQRSLMLNIASLAPGPYLLRISVERPGRPVAVSQRRVVLEP